MTRNKNRIYMALYARTGPQSHIHHVSLLVSPKNPNADGNNTWRIHAMNIPNPAYVTMQEWQYQAILVLSRTTRLLALVLLGKTVKSGQEIGQILTAVDIVQDNPSWTCKEWVFTAIELLITQNIVKRPPIPLENLYAFASTLADAFKGVSPEERGNSPVPTCNNSGVVIRSEVK